MSSKRSAINNPLRLNILTRMLKLLYPIEQPCCKCGHLGGNERHHPDYKKPLEIIWLCKKCHRNESPSISKRPSYFLLNKKEMGVIMKLNKKKERPIPTNRCVEVLHSGLQCKGAIYKNNQCYIHYKKDYNNLPF